MAQTHYIESDEEIITAVGRLRKTGEAENIFVFPKRALILQSIVNLKLLEREAKKLGKKIIVVTQDTSGKLLAEKAGLATKEYTEESSRPPVEQPARFTVEHTSPTPLAPEGSIRAPRSTALGSLDFYAGKKESRPTLPPQRPQNAIIPQPVQMPNPRPLRIRNATPPVLTMLNSKRDELAPKREPLPLQAPQTMPQKFVPQARNATLPTLPTSPGGAPLLPRQEKLRRFMASARERLAGEKDSLPLQGTKEKPSFEERQEKRMPATPILPHTSKAASWTFIFLGIFSAVAIVGALLFIVMPKATVTVIPQGTKQDFNYQFIGLRSGATGTETGTVIPARVEEAEKSVNFSADSTGSGTGEVGKARGTVVISNNYSTDPQPLVATTRLVTSDGKIFRLVQGVTVPGMTNSGGSSQPGIIETQVIANESGESYNVGPTTFTIPGFQGSTKYEKFTGKSLQAFAGGGSGNSSGQKTVSLADLDTAKVKAMNEAKENFKHDMEGKLQIGEKLLEESIEVTLVGTPTTPGVGSVASNFSYQGRFRVRGFIVSEESIKNFIEKQAITSPQSSSVILKAVSYELVYGSPLANFDGGKVEFSVQVKAILRAPVDTETLRSELLGQNEAGIRSVLEKHPEIKSLQVEFEPRLFITSIPKSAKRVSLIVGNESE